jgi:cellulose synthase operon protein C
VSDDIADPEAFTRALEAMSSVAEPVRVEDDRWAYREAAAVRATFLDFAELRPVRDVARGSEAHRALRDDCTLVPVADGGALWRLDDGVRDAALKHLGSAAAITRAIELNPAPEDDLQQQLGRLVAGDPLDLEHLTFGELTYVHQLAESLRGIVPDLPDADEIDHRLAVADLLSPLHGLTEEGFHGRADVLEQLRDHVFGSRRWHDVLNLDTVTQSIGLGVNQLWFTLRDRSRPPLLLHGPGGSGKSTVIARFLLDHMSVDQPRVVLAHIDFDRPRFDAEEPLTLLGEALRQLSVQAPNVGESARELRHRILARLSRKEIEPSTTALDAPRSVVGFGDREHYIEEFGRLLAEALGEERLLVMVLDTLEEVQYRGQDYIEELWYFLGQLHAAVPALRVIAAGRTPLRDVTAGSMLLGDLDEASGRAFLHARLDGLGVDPREIIDAIVERIGCNPLTLKLAADVVREAGPEALGDALGKRQVRRRAETEAMQGVLYRRILDHIHDSPIKDLALPGLALRQVTPDVIRHVLSPACSLEVDGDVDAVNLFERFAREVALVERSRDGSLRYRNDVRRLALRLVETDPDVPLKRVDEVAVDYFQSLDDDDSRAEEIYHRLRLRQDREELDTRWRPELSTRLGSALDDLSGAQYVWLATKLGLTLSSAELAHADQADWETQAERRARYYIELEDPRHALKLLRERKARLPGSRLAVLETVALEQLGRHKEAAKLLNRAAKAATRSDDDRLEVDLAMASARVRHHLGDDAAAQAELDRAAGLSRAIADPILELQVLLAAADLGLVTQEESLAVEDVLARIPPSRLADEPQLLSAAAGEFGEEHPAVLRLALRTVGLPGLRWDEIAPLASALEETEARDDDGWQLDLRRARRSPTATAELLEQAKLKPPFTIALAGIYRDRALRAKQGSPRGAEWQRRAASSPVPIWANSRPRHGDRS